MFYHQITKARDIWYNSKECKINKLISYMQTQSILRDAQIEAIKTYLYLKIACENKPLYQLFCEGAFNTFDFALLNDELISQHLRNFLKENKDALALYECAKHNANKPLLEVIHKYYANLNYKDIFTKIFYDISYTDYLFSLPMGAGKTYLMAAFIYLDLYFAKNEPHNKAFAHNFLILAPSGLKSSILPSLKNIEYFNPSWILPEPSASEIKSLIKFEILNESKADKRSNKTRNPNVAKIAQYQPFNAMFGVVLLTNAEKVILDKIDKAPNLFNMLNENDRLAYQIANELRTTIGKIPNLSIFIDEVHHAALDDVKLRRVVNEWSNGESITMVAGFSGTPYLKSEEEIAISTNFSLKHKQIANTVYYYPLLQGIGNFLKTPIVKISSSPNRLDIVESGLRDFLENSSTYANALNAKIAIYCGSIENLEEQIYPKICEILSDYHLNQTAVLKFHKGNKSYPEPKDAQNTFNTLDSNPIIKVILLVQIGKEGWDCKSLSSVILSQEKDCPTNMVLQTSCRCLRQAQKGADEKALIYLNKSNADKLSSQLKAEQQITLSDFQNGAQKEQIPIYRHSRIDKLKLPPIDFYQIQLNYDKTITKEANPQEKLANLEFTKRDSTLITQKDFSDEVINSFIENYCQREQHANFYVWLYDIAKESFMTLSLQDLKAHLPALQKIFAKITHKKNGICYFSNDYDKSVVESDIRKAFSPKRDFTTTKEILPQNATLLLAEKLHSPVMIDTQRQESFLPDQDKVAKIIDMDKGAIYEPLSQSDKETLIKLLGQEQAQEAIAKRIEHQNSPYITQKDKTFHYLPYRTDSAFEKDIFTRILNLQDFKDLNLELYYNGDSHLTEFRIQTYKNNAKLGLYTPDFLILKREKGVISKVLILETKGEGYTLNFKDKKDFMKDFIESNNEKYGYKKFEFLYIEDSQSVASQIAQIQHTLEVFFSKS
ncbi:hypothetical protein [Helicobacter sp. T3_23-1059]